MSTSEPPRETGEIEGKWVVIAMFAFAITAVGLMYVYWRMHKAPFVPLQQALHAEFPESAPRVEGGQRKMHEHTPRVLRITMKVDFDPNTRQEQSQAFAGRVADFVSREQDLSEYDILEIHLFWPEPEREIKQWSIEMKTEELLSELGLRQSRGSTAKRGFLADTARIAAV